MASAHGSGRRQFTQGFQKQFVHPWAQVGERRGAGAADGPEDPFERVPRRASTEAKTKGGNALRTQLSEGLRGIGFRVPPFVAVVVREAVGKDDQQSVRRAGLALENVCRSADSGASSVTARVAAARR